MRATLLLLISLITLQVSAQIYNPVKWAITLTPAGNGDFNFIAKATIDDGWWVYSQFLENEDGPIATTVNFDAGIHYKLEGKSKESENAKKIFDQVFEMEVVKFQKYYTIQQKIKVTDPSKPISGYINFMTCNDVRCLAPTDAEFELFATGGSTGDAGKGTTDKITTASNSKSSENVKSGSDASVEKKR